MCLSVVSEDSNEYVGTTSYDFSVDDHNKQIKCEATTPGFDNEKMESTGTISIEGEWAETKKLYNQMILPAHFVSWSASRDIEVSLWLQMQYKNIILR